MQIKVAMGVRRWSFEHRVVWEAANGPIPEGQAIHHLNGDKADNRLGNLLLVPSNSEHHRVYHPRRPPEQGEAISRANRGKAKTPEHRAKIAAAHKGKPKSEAHKQHISESLAGRRLSEEHAEKIRQGVRSPEYRAARSELSRRQLDTMRRDEKTGRWVPRTE